MTDYLQDVDLQDVDLSTNTATDKNEYFKIYYWYINGKLHRDDGPAIIDEKDKIYQWYFDGKLHRLDGPAYIDWKYKIYHWWQDDKLHRVDGPAVIDDEHKRYEWWIHGVNKTEEITKWLTDNEIDWRNMSLEEKIMLTVTF